MIQIYNQLTELRSKEYSAIMLGLAAAGKTGLVQQFLNGKLGDTLPTQKPTNHDLTIGQVVLHVMDVGGDAQTRQKWPEYAKDRQIIIFVVNTLEQEELMDAKHEFGRLLERRDPSNCIALILINKIDLGIQRVSVADAVEGLELNKFKGFRIGIFGTSALTGFGVPQAQDWLISATANITPLNANPSIIRQALNIGLNARDLAISTACNTAQWGLNKIIQSDKSKRAELQQKYNKLAEERKHLLFKLQQEREFAQGLEGSLSQRDSKELIEKYDRQAHDIYAKMVKIDIQKQLITK